MNGGEASAIKAHSPGEPLARGATIGRYVVLGLLGRGGMGDVYAAYDPELDRKVAVKLVRAVGDAGAAGGRTRLLREAQAIAKLSHPNVVVVYDVGTFGDSVFIAMEFVDGQTVGYWLQAQARSWREVLTVFQAAGRGLAAAHQAGMIHRDFKPDNVMVTREGQVRVMDFGLARQLLDDEDADGGDGEQANATATTSTPPASAEVDPDCTVRIGADRKPPAGVAARLLDSKLTSTGAMVGTPAYMAPEQFAAKATQARTDQFSFCVALYESLYGQRPFAGKTIAALTANVLAGTVSDPPPDAKVPAWLRRILLRGLQADPAARWPSMQELLAALAHDPKRTRRRWLAASGLVLAGVTAVVATGAGWRAAHGRPQLCLSGEEKVTGAWESAGLHSPRRDAVRRAFIATQKGYAKNALASVERILDEYTAAWTRMYSDACVATHVRGEQSAEVLDLRMSCLSERLGRVKALVDVFMDANATVVENAVAAASALPRLDRCSDTRLLRTLMPPPEDPVRRGQVEALRRDLAHVKALNDSGQCSAGVAAGRKLVADADTVGYLPLTAEARNALALFGNDCLDPAEALQHYKVALRAALASHHDEAAVEAVVVMAHVQADRLREIRQARDWIDLGTALLQRLGPGYPTLESWVLGAQGAITSREGRHAEALTFFERALALNEKTHGPAHTDVVLALNNMGVALQDMKRLPEAVTYFDRARRLQADLVGPDHPVVALALCNRGEVLNELHLYNEALADNQRAVEIWTNAGAGPFFVAYGLTQVGESLLGLGKRREAVARLQQALALHEQSHAPFFPTTRFALARALWPSSQDRPRALELARAARDEYERTGDEPTRLAQVTDWLRDHGTP